jgi:hypothetical protein
MKGGTVLAAALAVSALAAPSAVAAEPDLSQMALTPGDLPSGTKVLTEFTLPLAKGVREYDRSFKLRPGSGFTRLNSTAVLGQNPRYVKALLSGMGLLARDNPAGRRFAKLLALEVGVRANRVRVSRPRRFDLDDGALTFSIRANRRIPIVVGVVRVGPALAEIEARGIHGSKGLVTRTRGVVRIAAGRIQQALAPRSLTPPAITGTAQVGATLQASPGTWSDATTIGYAWQRCDAAGTCTSVPNATQQTYTVTAADAGSTLRVAVTAANSAGTTTAESAPTATVTS